MTVLRFQTGGRQTSPASLRGVRHKTERGLTDGDEGHKNLVRSKTERGLTDGDEG